MHNYPSIKLNPILHNVNLPEASYFTATIISLSDPIPSIKSAIYWLAYDDMPVLNTPSSTIYTFSSMTTILNPLKNAEPVFLYIKSSFKKILQ